VIHTKPLDANCRPYADGHDTEQLARPVRCILNDLKLPAWEGGAAWPPNRPCWGLQLVASMGALPAPPITREQIAARDAALREDSERVIAH
jgi:hypothetical protein